MYNPREDTMLSNKYLNIGYADSSYDDRKTLADAIAIYLDEYESKQEQTQENAVFLLEEGYRKPLNIIRLFEKAKSSDLYLFPVPLDRTIDFGADKIKKLCGILYGLNIGPLAINANEERSI